MRPKPGRKARATTIDEYLAPLPEEQRAALERLRKIVHAAAPGAEECISYQLPAFRLKGKTFFWIGAAANHCAIYGAIGADADDLKGYDTSGKGTIRFQTDNPLPATLVRKLVTSRVARLAPPRRKKTS